MHTTYIFYTVFPHNLCNQHQYEIIFVCCLVTIFVLINCFGVWTYKQYSQYNLPIRVWPQLYIFNVSFTLYQYCYNWIYCPMSIVLYKCIWKFINESCASTRTSLSTYLLWWQLLVLPLNLASTASVLKLYLMPCKGPACLNI